MSSLNDKTHSANERTARMIRRLVIGRLIAVVLLFAISWLWYGQTFEISGSQLPRGPLLVFLTALSLTAVYFLLLVIGRFIAWQAAIQIVLDAALISWLVYLTGGLTAPCITPYMVPIGIASRRPRPLGAPLASVTAVPP